MVNINPNNRFSVKLTANWRKPKLTVSYNSKHGSVSGISSGEVLAGTSLTGTFTAKEQGIKVVGWNNGSSYVATTNSYSFTMPYADLSLTVDTTFDYTTISEIRVLNVYPVESYADYFKNWMTEYGKNIIKVDSVYLQTFNDNPSQYMGTSNNWKYDVIAYGFADSNGGCNSTTDISSTAATLTKTFINENGSVIFGHDTSTWSCDHPNFASAQEKMGVDLEQTGNNSYYSTQVQITKDSIFTTYPYNIGTVGTIIEIPTAHTAQCLTKGETFLRFYSTDYTADDMNNCQNHFLFVNDNVSLIQTGHTSGTSSENEKKILANILFYIYVEQLNGKLD